MENQETFESALRALEEAVERLENEDLPLEESLACFEEGVRKVNRCRQMLQEVETRVELLLRDKNGALSVENFSEE